MNFFDKVKSEMGKIEGDIKSDIDKVEDGVKSVADSVEDKADNVVKAAENDTLSTQALKEVSFFIDAAEKSLASLQDFAAKLASDIAAKNEALEQVKSTIVKLQSIQSSSDTSASQ